MPFKLKAGKYSKRLFREFLLWRSEFFFGSEAIAEMLPLKIRRIVGIILLSAGIILGIIGLVFMILFQGSDLGLGGMGELIWLISIGLGAISNLMSIDFFRKYE